MIQTSVFLRLVIATLLLLALSGLPACKSLRVVDDAAPDDREWKALLAGARQVRLPYEVLNISGRADLTLPEGNEMENISVAYRIKMVHDSAILIRVTKIIEVARILATRDSIFVLDKINRTWGAFGYALAAEYTGLDLDFGQLQALLLGDFVPVPATLSPLDKKDINPRRFAGEAAGTAFVYALDTRILRLVQLDVTHLTRNQAAQVRFADHQPTGDVLLPMQIGIRVTAPDTLSLGLTHSRIELAPASARPIEFSIPQDYERMEPE